MADNKQTTYELVKHDGDPYYNLTCKYEFTIGNQKIYGQKAYFGAKNIGLSPEIVAGIRDREDRSIFVHNNDPNLNVGFFIFPSELNRRLFYITICLTVSVAGMMLSSLLFIVALARQ